MNDDETLERPRKKLKTDTVSEEDFPSINKLPQEMLIEIFHHLSLRDRKNAKLVCKTWNEVCSVYHFTDTEKFFFNGIYVLKKILNTLFHCKNESFNLEFHETNFSCPFEDFWKNCGPKIRSFVLTDCQMNFSTMKQIIMNCVNLTSLVWRHSKEVKKCPFLNASQYQKLKEGNVVRKKLQILEMDIYGGQTLVTLLNDIFTVFPSIETFTIHVSTVYSVHPMFVALEELMISNRKIFDKLQLKFSHLPESPALNNDSLITILNCARITSLPFFTFETPNHWAYRQDIHYKHLEFVSCYTCQKPVAAGFENFVSKFLSNCNNLKFLEICSHRGAYDLCPSLWEKISRSSLETVVLSYYGSSLFTQCDLDATPPSHTIRSLSVIFRSIPRDDELKYLQNLIPSLRHLSIVNGTSGVLKVLGENQSNLVSLSYTMYESDTWYTSRSICDFVSAINKFKDLLYLRVELEYDQFATGLVGDFNLPNIRYFELCLRYGLLSSDLKFNLPVVECLSLQNIDCSYENWISFIRRLKKLRFLRLIGIEISAFSTAQCKGLFHECPSLRYLVMLTRGKSVQYFFDIFRKKVVLLEHTYAKHKFTSESISPILKHWAGPEMERDPAVPFSLQSLESDETDTSEDDEVVSDYSTSDDEDSEIEGEEEEEEDTDDSDENSEEESEIEQEYQCPLS